MKKYFFVTIILLFLPNSNLTVVLVDDEEKKISRHTTAGHSKQEAASVDDVLTEEPQRRLTAGEKLRKIARRVGLRLRVIADSFFLEINSFRASREARRRSSTFSGVTTRYKISNDSVVASECAQERLDTPFQKPRSKRRGAASLLFVLTLLFTKESKQASALCW